MPAAIAELIAEKAAASSAADHAKSIRDRLKPLLDLFKISRYRPMPSGSVLIDEKLTARGGQAKKDASQSTTGSGGTSGGEGGTAGGVYAIFQKEDGRPGERVKADPFPDVRWITVRDGTREPGVLEDRAARFLMDQNLLLVNADFRVFADMVGKFVRDYGGNAALRDTVEDAVRAWFEQALIETVIGVQALRNAKEWSIQEIGSALSEEALTAVVMPRYHVHHSVKRELRSRLGKTEVA